MESKYFYFLNIDNMTFSTIGKILKDLQLINTYFYLLSDLILEYGNKLI